jgi:hypothetical protein
VRVKGGSAARLVERRWRRGSCRGVSDASQFGIVIR